MTSTKELHLAQEQILVCAGSSSLLSCPFFQTFCWSSTSHFPVPPLHILPAAIPMQCVGPFDQDCPPLLPLMLFSTWKELRGEAWVQLSSCLKSVLHQSYGVFWILSLANISNVTNQETDMSVVDPFCTWTSSNLTSPTCCSGEKCWMRSHGSSGHSSPALCIRNVNGMQNDLELIAFVLVKQYWDYF